MHQVHSRGHVATGSAARGRSAAATSPRRSCDDADWRRDRWIRRADAIPSHLRRRRAAPGTCARSSKNSWRCALSYTYAARKLTPLVNGRCARSSIMCSLRWRPAVLVCVIVAVLRIRHEQAAERHRRSVARLPRELVGRQVVAERIRHLRIERGLLFVTERRIGHVQVDVVRNARAPVEEVAGVHDHAAPTPASGTTQLNRSLICGRRWYSSRLTAPPRPV